MRTLSLIVAFCMTTSTFAADQARRPNIILVMADDLGWSDIGCYGGEIRTPHIDSLARDGLRFSQFYNNSVCGPTRASLLTGLYCQQVGHRGDHWNQPKNHKKCVIISEVLQNAGYRTMMVGKWQGRDSALDRGFDRFFGPMCQGKISYFHEVERNPYFLDRKRWQPPNDFYMTDAFNNHAELFLKESLRGKSPFFLYVAHIAPHWPLHAREAGHRAVSQAVPRNRLGRMACATAATTEKKWDRSHKMESFPAAGECACVEERRPQEMASRADGGFMLRKSKPLIVVSAGC